VDNNIFFDTMAQIEGIVMFLFLIIFFLVLPCYFCVKRAEKVKRSKIIWGISGIFFSYFAIIAIYSLSKSKKNFTIIKK